MNTVLGKRTIGDLQRQASELKDQLEKFNTTLANIASVANTKMQESEKRQKKRKKKSKKKTAPNSFLLFRSKWTKENKGLYPDYLERMDKVKQAWNELADEERIVFENEHNRLKRERDAELENVYEPPRKKVKVIKKSTSKANVVVIRPSTPVVEEVTPVVEEVTPVADEVTPVADEESNETPLSMDELPQEMDDEDFDVPESTISLSDQEAVDAHVLNMERAKKVAANYDPHDEVHQSFDPEMDMKSVWTSWASSPAELQEHRRQQKLEQLRENWYDKDGEAMREEYYESLPRQQRAVLLSTGSKKSSWWPSNLSGTARTFTDNNPDWVSPINVTSIIHRVLRKAKTNGEPCTEEQLIEHTSDIAQEAYRVNKNLELYISEIFDFRNFSEHMPTIDLSMLKDIVKDIKKKMVNVRNEKRNQSMGISDPWYED